VSDSAVHPLWILSALIALVTVAVVWGWLRYRSSPGIEDLATKYDAELVGALADRERLRVLKTLNMSPEGLTEPEILLQTDVPDASQLHVQLEALLRVGAVSFDDSLDRYRSSVEPETVRLFEDAHEKDADDFGPMGRGIGMRQRLYPYMPPLGDPDRLEILSILSENIHGMTYYGLEKASEARCPRCLPKLKLLLLGPRSYVRYDGVRYYSLVNRNQVRQMQRGIGDILPD